MRNIWDKNTVARIRSVNSRRYVIVTSAAAARRSNTHTERHPRAHYFIQFRRGGAIINRDNFISSKHERKSNCFNTEIIPI